MVIVGNEGVSLVTIGKVDLRWKIREARDVEGLN